MLPTQERTRELYGLYNTRFGLRGLENRNLNDPIGSFITEKEPDPLGYHSTPISFEKERGVEPSFFLTRTELSMRVFTEPSSYKMYGLWERRPGSGLMCSFPLGRCPKTTGSQDFTLEKWAEGLV